MKYILFIVVTFLLTACQDVKVGYLETEAAQYIPNVMEVVKATDVNEPKHAVSPPIQGVEGTQPILITIHAVKTGDGDVARFLKEVTVRGNGTFDVPLKNDIPAGTYIVTLKVENEGYSALLEDIFTIVVKE